MSVLTTLRQRVAYVVGQTLAYCICEPQLRLGRRRHDGHCEQCDDPLGVYRQERLTFPHADEKPLTLRAATRAEYEAICLYCDPDDAGDES